MAPAAGPEPDPPMPELVYEPLGDALDERVAGAADLPPGMSVELRPLDTLRPQEENYRAHNPYNLAMIQASLEQYGAMRSLVADSTGEIKAGSGTLDAARAAGFEQALVVRTPGNVLLVHQRDGVDAEAMQRYSILDNRATDTSSMDVVRLAQAALERPQLLAGLYDATEQEELIRKAARMSTDIAAAWTLRYGGGGARVPDTPVPGPTRTHRGDLWQLGGDRLIVGDATDPAVWGRLWDGSPGAADLVFTSPPYNAAQATSRLPNKRKYRAVADMNADTRAPAAYLALLVAFTTLALRYAAYVAVNVQSLAGNKVCLIDYLAAFRDQYADSAIWDKEVAEPAMQPNIFNSQYEYIHFFSAAGTRTVGTRPFRGTVSNVLRLNSRQDKEFAAIHRATFPLEFAAHWITTLTAPGAQVIDPFAGTGTTWLAAHKQGRACACIELDPAYADVILLRAEAEGVPVLRLEGPPP